MHKHAIDILGAAVIVRVCMYSEFEYILPLWEHLASYLNVSVKRRGSNMNDIRPIGFRWPNVTRQHIFYIQLIKSIQFISPAPRETFQFSDILMALWWEWENSKRHYTSIFE